MTYMLDGTAISGNLASSDERTLLVKIAQTDIASVPVGNYKRSGPLISCDAEITISITWCRVKACQSSGYDL